MASFREIDPALMDFYAKIGGPQVGVGPSAGMVDTGRLATALKMLSGMTRDSFLPLAGRAPIRAHPQGIPFMARAANPNVGDFIPGRSLGETLPRLEATQDYLQILRDLLLGGRQ